MRPLAALLATALATPLMTGCARQAPAVPGPAGQPPSAAAEASVSTPPTPDPLKKAVADALAATLPPTLDDQPVLTQVWLAEAPRGTRTQIALRFLQSLQRGDDIAAARELYGFTRLQLAGADLATLHRVMASVRRNAGLATSPRCTHAATVAAETAVVSCGRLRVVVHAFADATNSGVQIGDWFVHWDVYRGRHTHAYSTVQLI